MFDIANAAVRFLQADSLLQKDLDFALGLVSDFSGKLVKGVATPCLKTPRFPCPRALTAVMGRSLACTLPADQGLVCKCWSLPKAARGAGTQQLHKMASGCFKPGIQSDTQP